MIGPLIPLFWTSERSTPLGFTSQVVSLICEALSPTCNEFLRFISGVTPVDCIEVSMAAEPFQSTYHGRMLSASIGGGLQAWKPMTVCAASMALIDHSDTFSDSAIPPTVCSHCSWSYLHQKSIQKCSCKEQYSIHNLPV